MRHIQCNGAQGISVSRVVLTRGWGQHFYATSGFPFMTASGQNVDQYWAITPLTPIPHQVGVLEEALVS
jgi:hypothetical protein